MGFLGQDQIRLISFLDNDPESELQLSRKRIHTLPPPSNDDTKQTQAPASYIALSYCWGNERSPIQVDDQKLTVSSNLLAALKRLRSHLPLDQLFWADNLSINQTDLQEKTHQVGIMGRIFAAAETVIVWLGDDMDDVVQGLNRLKAEDMNNLENASSDPARVTLIYRLSQIPWFYRAWTFQEIRLASHAMALLGDQLIPWDDLIAKIQLLRQLEPRLSTVALRSEPQGFQSFTYTPQDRFFSMLDDLNTGTTEDLAGLLFLTWYRDATERSDKVYSLLSNNLLNQRDHGISINYTIVWEKLCIKAARACVNTGKNLKILKIAGMTRRWKSLATGRWDANEFSYLLAHPSWAPNWWTPPQQTRRHSSLLYDSRGCFERLNFCCNDVPEPQDINNTGPFLTLRGVLLGILNIGTSSWAHANPPTIHAPPNCVGYLHQGVLRNPVDAEVLVPQVDISRYVDAVNQHSNGVCSCFPLSTRNSFSGQSRILSPRFELSPGKSDVRFSNECFHLHRRMAPGGRSEHNLPAQVLPASVESGDWLVLLEGGGLPFIIRAVMDLVGRTRSVQELSVFSPGYPLPPNAGLFVLVGEASLRWDDLWPNQWERYCRVGTFVIV